MTWPIPAIRRAAEKSCDKPIGSQLANAPAMFFAISDAAAAASVKVYRNCPIGPVAEAAYDTNDHHVLYIALARSGRSIAHLPHATNRIRLPPGRRSTAVGGDKPVHLLAGTTRFLMYNAT